MAGLIYDHEYTYMGHSDVVQAAPLPGCVSVAYVLMLIRR